MKLFIFRPSNELAGKIDVQFDDAVPQELEAFFVKAGGLPLYSYAEMNGKTWTITSNSPFRAEVGRVYPPDRTQSRAVATSATTEDALLSAITALTSEIRAVRDECAKTKWAARGVGFLIALIVLFGFKIVSR